MKANYLKLLKQVGVFGVLLVIIYFNLAFQDSLVSRDQAWHAETAHASDSTSRSHH